MKKFQWYTSAKSFNIASAPTSGFFPSKAQRAEPTKKKFLFLIFSIFSQKISQQCYL